MKKRISITGTVIILSVIIYFSGLTALAADDGAEYFPCEDELILEEEEIIFEERGAAPSDMNSLIWSEKEATLEVESLKPEKDEADNDRMFAAYVDSVMAEDEYVITDEAAFSARRENLNNVGKSMYDLLKTQITKAADGERADTAFVLKLSDIFGASTLTAKDLGVSTIFEASTGSLSSEAYDLLFGSLNKSLSPVLMSLLDDMPYELYWFDKTAGWKMSGHMTYRRSGNDIFFPENSTLTVAFYVIKGYSTKGSAYTCEINTQKSGAARAAKSNAMRIVRDHEGESDYEKLNSYREEICKRVQYDYDAINKTVLEYGDPWQIINVFDTNPSTNVVCEGYSKAFKLLCDMSEFTTTDVECFAVMGNVNGGAHMWNLVHMEDGQNYLVDLTNCDDGTFGYPDKLFMKGDPNGSANGYTVNTLVYDYEAGYAKTNYTESQRSISKKGGYKNTTTAVTGSQTENNTEAGRTRTSVTTEQENTTETPVTEDNKVVETKKTGWQTVKGKYYYYDENGRKLTGLQKIDGKYYFFSKKGVRQTGFKKINKKYYYFDNDGVRKTGWVTVKGKKYYLNKKGVRQTGFKKIGGKWYYFRSNGTMVANKTMKIGGKTYKFDKNGVTKKK